MQLKYPNNVYKLRLVLSNYHEKVQEVFDAAKPFWELLPYQIKNCILQLDNINGQLEDRFKEIKNGFDKKS